MDMEETTLFEDNTNQPLAWRLRPRNLEEFVGQQHLIGEGKILRKLMKPIKFPPLYFGATPE